jgi:hypothetical protein
MKHIKTLVGVFAALALFATVASAAPSTNLVATTTDTLSPWTFSLSGQGNSTLNNNSTYKSSNVGAEFQLGYITKIVLPAEVGLRQTIGYSDSQGANWNLSTKAFSDWTVIRVGNLEADAGGNFGTSYGNQAGDWTAAPEVVGRLYLKKDVDVFGRVEYPYDITKGASQDTLTYTIGLRVRF